MSGISLVLLFRVYAEFVGVEVLSRSP